MKMILTALFLIFSFFSAHAFEPINYSIYQPYTSPRALGMGNAFIALADDYNALYYNPAGLARLQEGELNFKIQAGVTSDVLNLKKDIEQAQTGTETEKQNKLIDLVVRNYGKNYWLGFPTLAGTWARPGWGFGFVPVNTSIDIGLEQSLGPAVAVEAYIDSTIAYGLAKNYMDKKFSIGITTKAVHRGYVGKVIPAAEFANSGSKFYNEKDLQEGLTFDVDLGTMYTIQANSGLFKTIKPTFAIVGRNLVDYGFTTNFHLLNKNSTEPPKLGRRLDIGSSWELPSFWVFQPRFLLDERDIGHQFWTLRKGLHMGFELAWNAYSWLCGGYRIGLSQGYLTAGISAQFTWFRLDLATWGEEIGTTNTKEENRRYIVQMSLDF